MKNFLLNLSNLLDWIYKKKCYFCRSSKECVRMCSECYDKMPKNSYSVNRVILGSKVYTCGIYTGEMQKLIRGLKYHQQRDLAFYLAKFMYEYWSESGNKEDYVVVPVPMAAKRKKKRKYNHMDLVAEEFCKLSGYEYELDLIKRVKETKPQYNLKKNERMENLKDAFVVNYEKIPQKPILLIDDICTTGSTFESMIMELHKNNVYNITCISASTVEY